MVGGGLLWGVGGWVESQRRERSQVSRAMSAEGDMVGRGMVVVDIDCCWNGAVSGGNSI